ncbi:MAG: metallophosphoesterase [Cephaloticoccus sp.]|nr:metallophosphoesterase [Cephaloticoccus sp.]MCF7762000.1 metallophosphoesterase [Cephaloticoccus sp.]
MNFRLLLIGFWLLSVSLGAEELVVGGPFAVNVTHDTATIGWVVQNGEVRDANGRLQPVLRGEHMTLNGLKPGETRSYVLPNGTEGSFKVPPTGATSFTAVIFGDTRSRHELHRQIVAAITRWSPDFVLHTGDLVANGLDPEQWPLFFDIEKPLLAQAAFYPALGNHERNSPQFHEFFAITKPYYSFDWGRAHFTVINTDLGTAGRDAAAKEVFWEEQKRWMEDDLVKAQSADFRLVIMHHPPFTAFKKRQSENQEVRALVTLWEQYRVTATFGGHDHNYQHHLVHGVHHIVTGGGGAPLYAVDAPIEGLTLKVESIEHYVRLQVEPGKASVEAVALDGRILDAFEFRPAAANK